jgi:hypothetical protein
MIGGGYSRQERNMNEQTRGNTPRTVHLSPSWRRYPHVEAAIETDTAAVLADMEQTRTEIERSWAAGSTGEQERARIALIAYRRALELYQYLVEQRDKLLQARSNIGSGTSINE